MTEQKGEGVFATTTFVRRDTVMVGTILQELSGNDSHASQVSRTRWVRHGGLISKVNHSCDPNCGIHVNETGAHDFVAMKTIQVGDEITFDYDMRNFLVESFPAQCKCGASNCRGSITGYRNLPAEFKKRYEGFIAPYLLELEASSQ